MANSLQDYQVKPEPSFATEQDWYKASVFQRGAALAVDILILVPLGFLSVMLYLLQGIIISNTFGMNVLSYILSVIIGLVCLSIPFIYHIFLVWKFGVSIGKKLFQIQVVNTNYQQLTLMQAFMRETIGKLVSGLVFGLGFWWAIWDKDKQTWHDKLAKTYVVTKKPDQTNHLTRLILIVLIVILIIIFDRIIFTGYSDGSGSFYHGLFSGNFY